jgi:hypothetical protein
MALIEYDNKNSPAAQMVGSVYSPPAIPVMNTSGISSLTTSPLNVALGLAKRMGSKNNPLPPVKGLENTATSFGNIDKQKETVGMRETVTSTASPSIAPSFPMPSVNPPIYNPPNIPPSVYASLAPPQPHQQQQSVITAESGGGIRGLLEQTDKDYSVQNQNTLFNSGDTFERKPFSSTPDSNLLSGEGYISNILGGHTIPLGLSNPQQLQKPLEAFPTGGQMNYDNTLQADYSRPQSFYAMPNMNRMT